LINVRTLTTTGAVRGGATLLAIALLAGCSSSNPASVAPSVALSSPSAAPSVVASATPSPTVASPASASPSVAVGPLALCLKPSDTVDCAVPAGTYTTAPITPSIMFTIGDGWRNDIAWPDGGEISRNGTSFGWFSGLRPSTPDAVVLKTGTGVDQLIAHLRTIKGFTVGPVSAVTLGGVAGKQVDVSSNDKEDNWIFVTKISGIGMRPDDRIRMMFFAHEGSVIMIGLESKPATFDAAVAATQSVLDSIRWN